MRKKSNIVKSAWGAWLCIIAALFVLIIGWGVLSPILVSNIESDFGVFAGILVALLTPGFAAWMVYIAVQFFNNNQKSKR